MCAGGRPHAPPPPFLADSANNFKFAVSPQPLHRFGIWNLCWMLIFLYVPAMKAGKDSQFHGLFFNIHCNGGVEVRMYNETVKAAC
jgi:hypothetical protein